MKFLADKSLALNRIKKYTNVLKKSNIDNMFNYENYWLTQTSISPINMMQGYFPRTVLPYNKAKCLGKKEIYLQVSNEELQDPIKFNDVQSILYCFMIHPHKYDYFNDDCFVVNKEYKPRDYTFVLNWYDIEQYNVFYYNDLNLFEKYIINQKDFINKIKNYDVDRITENDLDNYAKYMELHKKYPDEFLVPTLNIDIIWHAHMLDCNMYRDDSHKILGKVLDHNDDAKEEDLNVGFDKMLHYWKKEYEESLIEESLITNNTSSELGHGRSIAHTPRIVSISGGCGG